MCCISVYTEMILFWFCVCCFYAVSVCFFIYVKLFEFLLCMKCAIQIKLPRLVKVRLLCVCVALLCLLGALQFTSEAHSLVTLSLALFHYYRFDLLHYY